MKKLNKKGFTLIELLAVITIMGILMIVAIPAISRTIENSRRDTFLDTAKKYADAVKTMWISDSLECPQNNGFINDIGNPGYLASSLGGAGDQSYYVLIDSTKTGESYYPSLLESGGKSSWSNKDVSGYVKVVVSGTADNESAKKVNYYVVLNDGTHGITQTVGETISYMNLKRADVVTSGARSGLVMPDKNSARLCREV